MLPSNLRLAIGAIIPLLRGWEGKVERPYRMADLILEEKPNVVVEIGVFGGQSFIPQAMALQRLGRGRIYGIDPYNLEVIKDQLSDMDDSTLWLKQDMDIVREDTLKLLKALRLHRYGVIILGQSQDCASLFKEIDILHIDGNHTQEGVASDVNLYARKVRVGGHIWMDDTHFPSVQEALKELETFCDLVDDWGGYRLYRVRENGNPIAS